MLRLTPAQFRGISIACRASGIGAVVRQHWLPLHQLDPRSRLCWVGIGLTRYPGNLGTVLRTAEAANAGVIFLGQSGDSFDPTVIRASMGAIFGLPLARATHEELVVWSQQNQCRIVGTSPAGDVPYTALEIDEPLVILFGEERKGLTREDADLCFKTIRIPMADSLNLGVAAGVVLFDLMRRHLETAGRF